MREETAAAAYQVMQAEKKLQMERSIEAARVAQLKITEQLKKEKSGE